MWAGIIILAQKAHTKVGWWDFGIFQTADAGISRVFPYKRLRVAVLTGACLGKMDGMLVSIEKTYFDKAHRLLSRVSGLSIQLS